MVQISVSTRAPYAAVLVPLLCWSLVGAPGCAAKRRDDRLGTVAKEWSKTIRASQVIPIYPLSEDLTVGDCFVVQRPTEDEVELWDREGFLPLTHHVARLRVENGDDFYPRAGLGTSAGQSEAATRSPSPQVSETEPLYAMETPWGRALRAAFPSFTIEVNSDAGADLSLPVQGIPIGLSALNAQRALAHVSLPDAFTRGIAASSLHKAVIEHFSPRTGEEHPLRRYEPNATWDGDRASYRVDYSYLRVVQRVYLIGSVNVSVQDASETRGAAAAFDAADATPEEKAGTLKERTALAQTRAAEVEPLDRALGLSLGGQIPGGSVRVTERSARAVSLKETFPRPLVVGYVSFDIPIGWGGELGSKIIATQVRLERSPYDRVAEWAALDPRASDKLLEWVSVAKNRSWLERQGAWYLDVRRMSDAAAAGELRRYLAGPMGHRLLAGATGFMRAIIAFVPIKRLEGQDAYNRITARVLHDVIRRPDGVAVIGAAPFDGTSHPLVRPGNETGGPE